MTIKTVSLVYVYPSNRPFILEQIETNRRWAHDMEGASTTGFPAGTIMQLFVPNERLIIFPNGRGWGEVYRWDVSAPYNMVYLGDIPSGTYTIAQGDTIKGKTASYVIDSISVLRPKATHAS